MNPDTLPEAVKSTVLHGTGVDQDIEVDVTFGWQLRANAPVIRVFVNDVEATEPAGPHKGLTAAIELMVGQKRASMKKKALSGLVAIVRVRIPYPRFDGARLEDDAARLAVRNVVQQTINATPGWWSSLHAVMR